MTDNVNGERQLPDQSYETPSGAPEGMNREQEDAQAQTQTVADDAIRGLADEQVDSESAPSGDAGEIVPDDAQDIVDRMNQMERSGVIDYDAYRGERSDDDEASNFGSHETDDHTVRLTDE